MRNRSLLFISMLMLPLSLYAQIQPSAYKGGSRLGVGGGFDYWKGNYNHIARFGPTAWVTADLWHGIGVLAEGHSMIAGGDNAQAADEYKYFSGEGGVTYTYRRWRRFAPFAKAEIGFSSLSFPHHPGATYTHDTRTTWALGAGFERQLVHHVWLRADYTYDNFPDFYSSVTGQHHTLNPNGLAVGGTWHF